MAANDPLQIAKDLKELAKYVKKRGAVRSATTLALNAIKAELKSATPDVDKLENSIMLLNDKESKLDELNNIVERLIDGDDVDETDFDICCQYSDDILEYRASATRFLHKLQVSSGTLQANSQSGAGVIVPTVNAALPLVQAAPPLQGSGNSSTTGSATILQPSGTNSVTGSATSSTISIRLPKLEMERFNGDLGNWLNFWTQFQASIHNNATLPNSAKFSYLKSFLSGSAARAIAGLALTDLNYVAAIKILEDRFGNAELIAGTHMNILTNLTPVKRATDIDGLKRLYDNCEVQIRSFQSLGVVSTSYGVLLCHVLTKMLPSEIYVDFNRTYDDKVYTVDDLLSFLRKEIGFRERAYSNSNCDSENKNLLKSSNPRSENRSQKTHTHASASALHVGATNSTPYVKTCFYCDDPDHKTIECKSLTLAERKEIVFKKQRCFICLRSTHRTRNCDSKYKNCSKCRSKHHVTLCDRNENHSQSKNDDSSTTPTPIASNHVGSNETNRNKMVLLQMAQALAKNPNDGSTKKLRCLLDNGSQVTIIKESVSRSLNLPVIGEEDLDVYPFEGAEAIRSKRRKVRLELSCVFDPKRRVIIEAFESKKEISGAVFSVPSTGVVEEMNKRGLRLVDAIEDQGQTCASSIDLLLGSDEYWGIVYGKFERLSSKLVAQDTLFGWVINGPTMVTSSSIGVNTVAVMINAVTHSEEELVSDQLRAFWELDSIGITDYDSRSSELSEVLTNFEKSIVVKNGRYEVSFPWKPTKRHLAENFAVAKRRTQNLLRKLQLNPVLFMDYNDVIKEQLESGVVEKVKISLNNYEPEKTIYYLPHREVMREASETTKLRVVYDASSHALEKSSLNDCLEAGPNLNPELFDVLVRFRENRVAFTADITKAFLQISISEEDRDAVRFLWVDVNNPDAKSDVLVYRMTRVPFGVTSSPFMLAATLRYHVKKYQEDKPEICEKITEGLFVDDLLSGANDVEDAYTLSKEANEILKEAGMVLHKFKTNSPELRKLWNLKNHGVEAKTTQSLSNSATLKVLGLSWDINSDCLVFNIDALLDFLISRKNTKRWVLKSVARIFDPLGLLSPFTVKAKFLFQELWQNGSSWDEELSPELSSKFNAWCVEIKNLKDVEIPRFYYTQSGETNLQFLELHTFVDASNKAYAAVAYLRYKSENGQIGTELVASKTRVAPLKKLSIPRLELMGAVLGSRLISHLLETFSTRPSKICMWTDSTIALQWIRGTATEWKPFVSNRVREIQTLTNPEIWNHCRTKDNPADLPTRGSTVSDLTSNPLWWKGPSWLGQETEAHPKKSIAKTVANPEVEEELRNSFRAVTQGVIGVEPATEPVLALERFSTCFLQPVFRITAWLYRFADNCRKKKADRSLDVLTAEELGRAEKYWIRRAQKDSYPTEVANLQNDQKIPKESKIYSLQPYMDHEGLICVGGRLTSTSLSYRERHPWILSAHHRLSELIAYNGHERLLHAGVNDTLVEVREHFWIPSGRQLVKKVVNHCNHCRWTRVQASVAEMAPLPSFRTTPAPVFEMCGLDFAGPLYTKEGNKCYIALLTCAVTRACHLELVNDMSADSFLQAFRRFIARRGIVKSIYSDNAKSFKRAELDFKELFKNIRSPEVSRYLGDLKISWRYIVERAAWWGGFWERLVRSVKGCLKRSMGQARLTTDEITTYLTEAEAVINSRPISYIYQDAGEPTPLTPAHFLVGGRLTALPSRSFPENIPTPATRVQLTNRLKLRQRLIDGFWSRWKTDYLLELRSAHHRVNRNPTTELKKDDVVLVEDSNLPRLCWKMAVIEEVFRGRDGIVRSCSVRLANGTRLKRPTPLLYNLELN